jgi:hypothetical protein
MIQSIIATSMTVPMKLRCVFATATAMLVGCGSSGPAPRPVTSARLVILSPTPNQVTGPDLTLQFQVIGGTVLPPTQMKGPLRGDQGHIHVKLDNRTVQMAYSTQAQLGGLTPGTHTVEALWVATDHLPFRNPVVAAVLFQVRA